MIADVGALGVNFLKQKEVLSFPEILSVHTDQKSLVQ